MNESHSPDATMRLRAEPPRVTRLSRKVLAGIGFIASLCVGGALVYALQSGTGTRQGEELYSTSNRQPADGLASLPRDYTGPILGPPLPGDLGRPILDAQRKAEPVMPPAIPTPRVDEVDQHRRAEEEAARTSRVFFQAEQRGTATANASGPPANPAASPYVLQAGAVIPAALLTGIRSNLPGQISAQVTENVYDSPTGRALLIPQGTRIVGQYDNGIGFGQHSVLLVWSRLIFPNGRSIIMERQPGTDAEGYAGLEDGVDYHWGELFKAAALSTILSVGAEAGSSGQESDIMRALRGGASDSVSQVGQQIVQRQLDIAPTITIRPGFPVRVLITRDLVLEPYGS